MSDFFFTQWIANSLGRTSSQKDQLRFLAGSQKVMIH